LTPVLAQSLLQRIRDIVDALQMHDAYLLTYLLTKSTV